MQKQRTVDMGMRSLLRALWRAAVTILLCLAAPVTRASDLLAVQPLTDRILMLHFNDGHVEHHQRGQPRSAEIVHTDPLDVAAAARLGSYSFTSADDPAYRPS